jgi:GT2 family glycosyltransferase
MKVARTFSVIVPTHNRIPALVECMRGITALAYPREQFQVIVVNDGGAEIPKSLAAAWKSELDLVLLKQENRGSGPARNLGARHAVNDWLAFTDDDCVPAPDWLRRFADASASAPDAALGGETRNGLPENIYAAASQCLISFLLDYYHRGTEKRSQVSFFPANNLALTRRVFEQVGGFDDTIRYAEERDLCERLVVAGFSMRYVPEARVDHFRPMKFKSFLHEHRS